MDQTIKRTIKLSSILFFFSIANAIPVIGGEQDTGVWDDLVESVNEAAATAEEMTQQIKLEHPQLMKKGELK